MGRQIQLLLLDAVLHLTAGTADLLMEGLSGVVPGRQRGGHGAGIGTAGQDLGFGQHPLVAGSTVEGGAAKVLEVSDRLPMLIREDSGQGQLGADGDFEAGIAGQAEQIVDLMVLTPSHQLLSGKAGVGPRQDLDMGPLAAQAGDDALDLLQDAGGSVDVGRAQQDGEQMEGAEDVER